MARSLNGIDFPANARWINSEWSGVGQSVQPTLGGTVIVFANRAFAQPIEIQIADYSFVDLNYRNEIMILSRQVGATFNFIWDSFVRTVAFSHHDIPVEFVPLIPTRDHNDPLQKFSVTIRLIVVS